MPTPISENLLCNSSPGLPLARRRSGGQAAKAKETLSRRGAGMVAMLALAAVSACSERATPEPVSLPVETAPPLLRPASESHRALLDALWMVEASQRLHPPDGDGGQSIGPYQISRLYWKDATDFDRKLGGSYEDCRDKAYAERVVLAYWRRYVPAGTDEERARVHNGGPQGHKKEATLKYWRKVEQQLKKQADA